MSAEIRRITAAELDLSKPEGRRMLAQEVIVAVLGAYLNRFHRFTVNLDPNIPKTGPYLAVTSHFSILDVVALMVGDPYHPRTTLVVKQEMMRAPVIGRLLQFWNPVSVDRTGHDMAAVRAIWKIFEERRGICIAGQGTRSRTGRLGPMDESLVNLAVHCAKRGVPVIPIVETDTDLALPAGNLIPKPYPIKLRAGGPIDLTGLNRVAAATLMQGTLAALLPERNRPLPGERVLWNSSEYVPKR